MVINIDGDRDEAILIINEEVYVSGIDHQCCLEDYWVSHNIEGSYKLDFDSDDYDEVHEKACEITYAKKNSHEVYGYDMFDTEYGELLLAHDKEIYEKTLGWMKEYAKDWNAKLGYFLNNGNSMDAEIMV